MRADCREALLDFLLEAVADGGTAAFPAHVLAGLRRVVGCEAVSYMEWSPQELLEQSLAAKEPKQVMQVWTGYRQVRHEDPLPGGASRGSPLPDHQWLGQPLMISDFLSDREFRRRGLYAEMCQPFGVRAVMKMFLPAGGATGAAFVFETTRSRFTETDRLAVQRIVPHLAQLRRNAHARRTYPALIDSTAAARTKLGQLTPREQVVLARAAAGETNTVIAQAGQKRPRCTPKSEWSNRARPGLPAVPKARATVQVRGGPNPKRLDLSSGCATVGCFTRWLRLRPIRRAFGSKCLLTVRHDAQVRARP